MREKCKFLSILVAAGIALAPLSVSAKGSEGRSYETFSIGLEYSSLTKALDATTAVSNTVRLPYFSALNGQANNTVEEVKLTEVLARVNYRVNDAFTPYLLLGFGGLSFDDSYRQKFDALPSIDTTVPYSDSLSVGFGFGLAGVLMELPAEMKLTYGVRMFTFESSDGAAVPPEKINILLAQLNPVEDMNFSTDVSYNEWNIDFGVSREYEIDSSLSITPQLGYRHSSISMDASTEVEYSPGLPYYAKGSYDRSYGGSLNSVILGVTADYDQFLGATLQVAIGDETGVTLAATYGF